MKKIITLVLCFQTIILLTAQLSAQVAINTTGAAPHPNAALDITGVNKGLLIPRGDAATRAALNANTAQGLMMYDIITNTVWYHNGNGLASGWQSLSAGVNHWVLNGALGTEIKNTNSGGFWSANTAAVLSNPGAILPPVSGAGTRLMWLPQKSAFRVGTVNSNRWDAANIGLYSFAGGYNSLASGAGSIAMGQSTIASGGSSTALGNSTEAGGESSTAMGFKTSASGLSSTAMGDGSVASGVISTAIGTAASATGRSSIAMGFASHARSFASVALGRYNDGIGTSDLINWVPTDPLLIVGNGATDAARHNAMVVYKNGDMVLKNPTTVSGSPVPFTVPVSGPGTRLMWLPQKSAFRVGTVSIALWDAANIGLYSFASGFNSRAFGSGSTAMGNSTSANGEVSTALGFSTNATGFSSIAMGRSTIANGTASTAMGWETHASSHGSVVMGRYNKFESSPDPLNWDYADPLLILGNGSGPTGAERNNALVVYKDGNTDISGYTKLGEGAPAIKMKRIIGTGPAVNGNRAVAHGLVAFKILSVQIFMLYGGPLDGRQVIPPNYTLLAGYEYQYEIDGDNIVITNKGGNSANIGGRSFRMLITYEE